MNVPLMVAAQSGDTPTLKSQIQMSPQSPEMKDRLGRTPLIHAVMGNRTDCLALLLKAGARVDNADNLGQTALHWAAYKGHSNCVRLLLAAGALWHQTDVDGVTPLHLAARGRSLKCLQILLNEVELGKVDIWDCQKRTALHWSAASVNVEHIKLLLKKDANVNINDAEGLTPLHSAASCNSPKAIECVKVLLEASLTIIDWQDYGGRTALHHAVITGTTEVVDLLVRTNHLTEFPLGIAFGDFLIHSQSTKQKSLDRPDSIFRTPLHLAAILGLSDKVALLLDRRASPTSRDANKATPIHYASWANHPDTISVFLARSYVTVDARDVCGCSAPMWAAAAGANKVIRVMADHGVDLKGTENNGNSVLHAAIFHGHVSTVRLLVSLGLNVEGANSVMVTPLLLACQMGRAKTVRDLLQCGALLDARDSYGRTSLHCAAIGGQALVMQILIRKGCDTNAQDNYGLNPLHYAAFHGHSNCLSVLLKHSADPNSCDHRGETALHWSSLRGKIDALRLLIQYGADPNAMSALSERYTPLDYATLRNQQEVVVCLLEVGGCSSNTIRHLAATSIQHFFKKHFWRTNNVDPPPRLKSSVDRATSKNVTSSSETIPMLPSNKSTASMDSLSQCKMASVSSSHTLAAITIQKAWRRHCTKKSFQLMRARALEIFGGDVAMKAAYADWQETLSSLHISLST